MKEVPLFETIVFSPKRHAHCVCVFVINEGERMKRQLERMKPFSEIADIIIADGGSTDGSLNHEFLKMQNVRALLVKTDSGRLGAQMRIAFSYALDEGYEGIIAMDGNNKDNPAAIPLFIKALNEGVDHAQGSRFIFGGKHENTPFIRLAAVRFIWSPLVSFAAGFRYTDATNGFRAYSSRFLLDSRVLPFRSVFMAYELHYYLAIRAGQLHFRIAEIPVERIYPYLGKVPTKINSWKAKFSLFFALLKSCAGLYNPK